MSEINNSQKPSVESYSSRYSFTKDPTENNPNTNQVSEASNGQTPPTRPNVSETAQLTAKLTAKHAHLRSSGKADTENS